MNKSKLEVLIVLSLDGNFENHSTVNDIKTSKLSLKNTINMTEKTKTYIDIGFKPDLFNKGYIYIKNYQIVLFNQRKFK
jgi:hypothetical protein